MTSTAKFVMRMIHPGLYVSSLLACNRRWKQCTLCHRWLHFVTIWQKSESVHCTWASSCTGTSHLTLFPHIRQIMNGFMRRGMACVEMILLLKTYSSLDQVKGICLSDYTNEKCLLKPCNNLMVLPEDSVVCGSSRVFINMLLEEKKQWSLPSMINRFQRLIVCIIVPDNHCSPLWMINISKTVGKASVQKPIFSALTRNYGRPSDVLQLIRIIA